MYILNRYMVEDLEGYGRRKRNENIGKPWLYSRKMGMLKVKGDLREMAAKKFGSMARRI